MTMRRGLRAVCAGLVLVGAASPSPGDNLEVCGGVDDDCDGQLDEAYS